MPKILITYDLRNYPSDIHYSVRNAMIAKGYSERAGVTLLPHNSLIKELPDFTQAVQDLKQSVSQYMGTITRFLCVEYITGECESND